VIENTTFHAIYFVTDPKISDVCSLLVQARQCASLCDLLNICISWKRRHFLDAFPRGLAAVRVSRVFRRDTPAPVHQGIPCHLFIVDTARIKTVIEKKILKICKRFAYPSEKYSLFHNHNDCKTRSDYNAMSGERDAVR